MFPITLCTKALINQFPRAKKARGNRAQQSKDRDNKYQHRLLLISSPKKSENNRKLKVMNRSLQFCHPCDNKLDGVK